jgi:uncharacterized protein YkwD
MKRFFAHLFLPHASNKYRAKVLHHSTLVVLIISFFAFNFFLAHIPKPLENVLGVSSSITPQELLILTNLKREERGLPPLTMNNELAQAAAGKAADMFSKNYWAHVAPDGTTPWVFIRGAGYEYIHAGENLARGFSTSGDVVNAWMESPGHRDNMLSTNYSDIGFAIVSGSLTGDETVLVVEMFGSRGGTQVAQLSVPSEPVTQPTATPVPLAQVIPSPVVTQVVQPTPTPTSSTIPTPTFTPRIIPESTPVIQVASITNEPLVNSATLQKNIAIGVLLLLLIAFVVDIIFIERKKIVRLLSHNIDHIIFFAILLLIGLLVGRGAVL